MKLFSALLAVAAIAQTPFACNRSALTPEVRKRHFDELMPQLRASLNGVRELADGFEFAFPSDKATTRLLTEWVANEHACCPFFDITLKFEREGGAALLSLTGRPGAKEFIRADFGKWFTAPTTNGQ